MTLEQRIETLKVIDAALSEAYRRGAYNQLPPTFVCEWVSALQALYQEAQEGTNELRSSQG